MTYVIQPFLNSDLENVYTAILGISGGGGDATAANQVLEIDALDLINTNLVDELDTVNENLVTINGNLLYAGIPFFQNPSNGDNYLRDIQSNTNELNIHNYFGIMTSATLSADTITDLETAFESFRSTNANKYQVDKQMVINPVTMKYEMFICYSTN